MFGRNHYGHLGIVGKTCFQRMILRIIPVTYFTSGSGNARQIYSLKRCTAFEYIIIKTTAGQIFSPLLHMEWDL